MRIAARVDNNHKAIKSAFEGMGCSVAVLTPRPDQEGIPDLLVGIDGVSIPVEVKDGEKPLNEAQQKWHREWRGSKAIVKKTEDAVLLVKSIRGFATERAKYPRKEKK